LTSGKKGRKVAKHTKLRWKYSRDPKVCPGLCLRAYLERSKDKETEFLFYNKKEPTKPLDPKTIAKITTKLMEDAGVDITIYKSHPLRGAAYKKAIRNGLPILDALKNGRCVNFSTARKHYDRIDPGDGVTEHVFDHEENKVELEPRILPFLEDRRNRIREL